MEKVKIQKDVVSINSSYTSQNFQSTEDIKKAIDESLKNMKVVIKQYLIKRAIEQLEEDRKIERDNEESHSDHDHSHEAKKEYCHGNDDSDEDSSEETVETKKKADRVLEMQLIDQLIPKKNPLRKIDVMIEEFIDMPIVTHNLRNM